MALRNFFNFGRNTRGKQVSDAFSPKEKENLFKVRQGIFNALETNNDSTKGKTEKVGISDIQDFSGIGDFGGMMNVYSKYIYQSEANKQQRVEIYREMSKFPEIAFAIDEYVDEAVNFDGDGCKFCTLKINNEYIKKDAEMTKTIQSEWDHLVYEIMKSDEQVAYWFREYLIDGEIAFEKIFDNDEPEKGITKVKKLLTTRIHPIWEDIETDDIQFFAYKGQTELLSLNRQQIAYANSGLYNFNSTEDDKMVLSILEAAKISYRRLKLLEDALVIYRIVRAPERRVFNIASGNLPTHKAESYLKNLMTKYRQRKYYDPKTGDVGEGLDPMAMTEDYWFLKYQDGKGSTVETLPGGDSLGKIEDVEYFLKKLYRGLKIPKSRWGEDDKFQIGGGDGEITREEGKFAKEVKRFCKRFMNVFKDTFITHLELKGIWQQFGLERKDIQVNMTNNNLFDKFFEAKIEEIKFKNFRNFDGLIDDEDPIFSTELIVKKYLNVSDEEWDDHIQKRMAEKLAKDILKKDEETDK
jgi:hypothetical protein